MTVLRNAGDFLTLGQFADWLGTSTATAAQTLNDLDIRYVRLGARGQYRISTMSVALAFGVPLTQNDDDAKVQQSAAVANDPDPRYKEQIR